MPASIVEGASSMIAEMKERRLIVDVALEDVLADLSNHTLCVEEAVACFQWWIGLASIRSYNRGLLSRLQNAAILTIDDGFAPLSSFQTFVNPKLIPLDLPFPPHTLPYAISRAIVPNSSLESVFELRPLSLPAWIQFLVSAKIIGAGTDATAEVLEKVSRISETSELRIDDSHRFCRRPLEGGVDCLLETRRSSRPRSGYPAFQPRRASSCRANHISRMWSFSTIYRSSRFGRTGKAWINSCNRWAFAGRSRWIFFPPHARRKLILTLFAAPTRLLSNAGNGKLVDCRSRHVSRLGREDAAIKRAGSSSQDQFPFARVASRSDDREMPTGSAVRTDINSASARRPPNTGLDRETMAIDFG